MEPHPQPAESIINMRGEKVALGPLRRDLVPLYLRWINDFEVTLTLSRWHPQTLEQEEAWYERASKHETNAAFTIYELETMRPIGTSSLFDVDHIERTAEFGIMIGEKDCWGKGYGTETARLVLDYGFNALDLYNIMLRVDSYNERGIRAYTRAGFKLVGRRREAHRVGGRGHDVIIMDCLATEFDSPVLRAMLPQE